VGILALRPASPTVPARFQMGGKRVPDSRSVPQPVLGRIAGKDDMNEPLWHDAAMQKARVFPGLERKLLDLSLVIPRLFFNPGL
jgi:hypothetical protein